MKWLLSSAWFAALIAFGISSQTLCGYWAGNGWQRWGPEGAVPMALNTATAIFLVAFAILLTIPVVMRLRSGIDFNHGM